MCAPYSIYYVSSSAEARQRGPIALRIPVAGLDDSRAFLPNAPALRMCIELTLVPCPRAILEQMVDAVVHLF